MKQMELCIERFFSGKEPLKSKKWKAFKKLNKKNEVIMALYHYHHLVMIFNLHTKKIEYQWWELPTDKRGLEAAKNILNGKYNKVNEG